MMGHVIFHDREALARIGARIVDGVTESVRSERTEALLRLQIRDGVRGLDHHCQRRRIGSDHQIAAQTAFERQVRDAERSILIDEVAIAEVVGAFAHAPWHSTFGAIGDLSPDRALVGLTEHRERKRAHNERRHQVLEHAPAPRDEGRLARGARERPPEMKPVLDRHIILGDGDEAGEPGLRREEIVIRRVECVRVLLIADGEQLPAPVEQEAEVHLHGKVVRAVGDGLETRREIARGRHLQTGAPNGNEVATQVAAVDRGDVGRLEHAQIVQIVPVVEMAAKPAHAFEGPQRQLEAPRHVLGGNEAEVARAHRRQQLQADVGWRHSHRRLGRRIILKVVRREPIGARRDERVEVLPVRPSVAQRDAPLLRSERRPPRRRGLAQRVGDRRCQTPGRDKWKDDSSEQPGSRDTRMRERA